MKLEDPILAARSIRALMTALNDVYGWNLPLKVPVDSPLAGLWAVAITVQKDPVSGVLYIANGSTTYPLTEILKGSVHVQVLTGDAQALPIGYITHRSVKARRNKHEQAVTKITTNKNASKQTASKPPGRPGK